MSKVEFVQAYARHILPARLSRVRFASLFSPRGRPERLDKCRESIARSMAAKVNSLSKPLAPVVTAPANSETASDSPEPRIGVFCPQCDTQMQTILEIDGSMSRFLLKTAWLVVAWLSQQRLPALLIPSDIDSITAALKHVLSHWQDEAFNLEHGVSLELMRCSHLTPGDLFYRDELYQTQLILITQELAKQQAYEDHLAQRLASPRRFAARGPPQMKKGRLLEMPA
jgi:hypothetical protein